MASPTPRASSFSGRSLRRYTSSIRTGCAKQQSEVCPSHCEGDRKHVQTRVVTMIRESVISIEKQYHRQLAKPACYTQNLGPVRCDRRCQCWVLRRLSVAA